MPELLLERAGRRWTAWSLFVVTPFHDCLAKTRASLVQSRDGNCDVSPSRSLSVVAVLLPVLRMRRGGTPQ